MVFWGGFWLGTNDRLSTHTNEASDFIKGRIGTGGSLFQITVMNLWIP